MKVVYSKHAINQLESILLFLVNEQGVLFEKAFDIRLEILSKAHLLISNPTLGQREEYLRKLKSGHRRLVVKNYKIIYLIGDQEIIITDVFDTRQDPEKMKG